MFAGPPHVGLKKVRESSAEILFAESRAKYVGSLCVGSIIAAIGFSLWQLLIQTAGGLVPARALQVAEILLALSLGVAGLLIWRHFGLHRRFELSVRTLPAELVHRQHSCLGRTRSIRMTAEEVREVVMKEAAWRGRDSVTIWELYIIRAGQEPFYLDGGVEEDLVRQLGKAVAAAVGRPLQTERRAPSLH